jgi:dolichol-phosphate mannosyltransferase
VTLSLFSALLAAVVLALTVTGGVVASIQAWILIAVLFLGGAQLVSVGIIGRYLARVHDQALGRPLYLVDRVVERRNRRAVPAGSLPARAGREQ